MKNKTSLVLCVLSSLIALTGCGFSSFAGTTDVEENVIPDNSLVATHSNNVSLDVGTFDIPDGYTIGSGEFKSTTGNKFFVSGIWKAEKASTKISNNESEETHTVDYKEVIDNDILFYIVSGEDDTSPDTELNITEAKSSIATYNNYFSTLIALNYPMIDDLTLNDSNGQPIIEQGKTSPRISTDGNWYYTTFTATSGKSVTTTYNTLCYPKSYYGIMMLGTNQNPDYSRKYYMFVFSNDSQGAIMDESEYDSLFSQIKDLYCLSGFYTQPQLATGNDSAKNYYKGRSYEQFHDLMQDTFNYYILKVNDNSTSSNNTNEINLELYND